MDEAKQIAEVFPPKNRRGSRLSGRLAGRALLLLLCLLVAAAAQAEPFRNTADGQAGSPLGRLSRLQTAAAWDQLAFEAARLLAIAELSGRELAWAHLYRAWGLLGRSEIAAAHSEALEAARLLPGNLDAELILCIISAKQGARREAEVWLKNRTLQGEPGSREYAALASFYRQVGDWDSAASWLAEALQREPHSAALNSAMAVTHWRLGDFAEAYALMEQAVRLAPGNADFYNERGVMLLTLGQPVRAQEDFSTALSLDPAHCGALLNRGNVLLAGGRASEGLADLSLGLSFCSQDTGLRLSRGLAYAAQQRYEEALSDLDTAWRLSGNSNVQALNALAWFLATCPDSRYHDGAQAVDLSGAALEQNGYYEAGLFDTLAAAQARSGEFQAAVETQKQALQKGAEQGLPAEVLGQWQARLGLYQRGLPYEQDGL